MKKEDISLLFQLLSSIRDAVNELEKAEKNKDFSRVNQAKKSILEFQSKVGEIL